MPLDRLPTPAEMVRHLDRFVCGQEQAKRDLALAFYEHFTGLASEELPELGGPRHSRQHTLLLGPTGCGKTYLVQTLCAFLGVPMAFWSATSMTEAGYVGDDVEEPLRHLVRQAGGRAALAHRGVVVLDEIDKIRVQETNQRDVSGEGVQTGLLTLLDGRRVVLRERTGEVTGIIDTGKLLFVCMGAFVALPDLVRKRLGGPARLGLAGESRAARVTITDDQAYATASPEDLIEFGLLPEFVGRFPNVTAVQSLGADDLVTLMREAQGSPVTRLQQSYAAHGLELRVEDDALRAIAERAQARGTGARGLDNALAQSLRSCTWRRHELVSSGVATVVLTRAAALGEAAPELALAPAGTGHGTVLAADTLRARALHREAPSTTAKRAALAVERRRAPRHEDPHQTGLELPLEGAEQIEKLLLSGADGEDEPELDAAAKKARVRALCARELEFARATEAVRTWWERFERERSIDLVHLVAEELAKQRITIERFVSLARRSGTLGVRANLRWLAYLQEREAFDRSRELLQLIQEEPKSEKSSRAVEELEAYELPPLPEV